MVAGERIEASKNTESYTKTLGIFKVVFITSFLPDNEGWCALVLCAQSKGQRSVSNCFSFREVEEVGKRQMETKSIKRRK